MRKTLNRDSMEHQRHRRYLHPFPARMAPDIAFDSLSQAAPESVVLDPMSGSGTVLRQAVECGLRAVGRDVDPLAVTIARAWTTPVRPDNLREIGAEVLSAATVCTALPKSIEEDVETKSFIEYWFAPSQRESLGSLALAIGKWQGPERDHLWAAFSRLIVTKDMAASLARDTAHSRPHRVALKNDFDVNREFERSVSEVAKRLAPESIIRAADVELGDARNLTSVEDGSVDYIVSSPPYLNAIDYLRGHRLSLVWMGWTLSMLREIRGSSVGCERGEATASSSPTILRAVASTGWYAQLEERAQRMINRYVRDLFDVVQEARRVLRHGGSAIYVIGNSSLRGVYVPNSDILAMACEELGLSLSQVTPRAIPESRRYLPLDKAKMGSSLARRMRSELVMEFVK